MVLGTLGAGSAWSQALPEAQPAGPPAAPAAPVGIAGAPRIQFDKTVYDFGKTSQVHQVVGKFMIKNAGEGVLKLQKPVGSCSCTVANLKTDTLQAGEECELSFTLNVGPGKQVLHKTITVSCNDPQTPQTILNIKVDYTPLIEAVPSIVYLQNLRMGETTNTSVAVRRMDGKRLVVTKVVTSDVWLKARYEPDGGTNETSGRIIVEVSPQGSPRRFYDNVRIVGEGNTDLATVAVNGFGVGDLVCTPEKIVWWLTATTLSNFHAAATNMIISNQLTRRVMINSTAPGRVVEVKNVSCSLPTVKTELRPRPNKTGYDLIARMTEPPKTNQTGEITFETSVSSMPKVTVPIQVQIWGMQTGPARQTFSPPVQGFPPRVQPVQAFPPRVQPGQAFPPRVPPSTGPRPPQSTPPRVQPGATPPSNLNVVK